MTSALYVQTRKEVRALLPWAVGVGLATVALALLAARHTGFPNIRYDSQLWIRVVYAAGLLTVAALSMGQEITHRTLPSLLMQPVDRRRLLWTKMTVLAAIATTLGVIGELTLPRESIWAGGEPRLMLVWGPAIIAVGLVPLLTLLSRKPLGGAVFSVVIPGLILAIAESLNPRLDDAHALTIAWYGTVIVSAFGLAALAYAFPRVETAGEDASPGSLLTRRAGEWSGVLTRTAPARRHWLWFAVTNELRLQQLTLVVSALFVGLGGIIVLLQRGETPYTGPGVGTLAALHGIFIAIIAGSRASADERHFGILATQALQPKAAWKTWTVKVMVTLSLALALSMALPWLFTLVDADVVRVYGRPRSWDYHPAAWWFGLERAYFASVVLTTIAALYVSSLSSNSLWALLACFPTGAACAAFAGAVLIPVQQWVVERYMDRVYTLFTPAMRASYQDPGWQVLRARMDVLRTFEQYTSVTFVAGLSLLLLYLASRNHRSLERGLAVVSRQIGTIALYLAAATALFVAVGRIAWWL
jgi:hypothetical protein